MTIYFAGSAPCDFKSMGLAFSTIAAEIDTNFVQAGVSVDSASEAFADLSTSGVTDAWFHIRTFINALNTEKSFIRVMTLAQRMTSTALVRIRCSTAASGSSSLSGTAALQLEFLDATGAAYTAVDSPFNVVIDVVHTFDLHVKLHGSTGVIELYMDGVLVADFSGNTAPSAAAADGMSILALRQSFSLGTGSQTYTIGYSEVIVANENTLDWRLAELIPTGAGANSGWAGAYTDVDDVTLPSTGDLDMITAAANDLKSTYVMGDISGSISGMAIVAVGVVARARKGTTGPQHMRGVVRISGTDYETSDVSPDIALAPTRMIWDTNPATSGAWSISAVNGAEFGMKATA